MNTYKTFGLFGLAAAGLLLAGQAAATPCPTAPVTGNQTQGSPVCINPQGQDGAGTGLANILAGPGDPNHNSNSIISGGPSVNPYTQQILSSYWTIGGSGSAVSTIMLQIAGNENNYTFGIYKPGDTSTTLALFTPGSANGSTTFLSYNALTGVYTAIVLNPVGATTATFNSSDFGFYLSTPQGNTFYSDPTLNETSAYYPNGTPHQVAYQGNGQSKITAAGGQINNAPWLSNEFIMAWEDLPYAQSDLDYNDFIVMVESVTPVPEPAVLGMFGLGLLLIGAGVTYRRRRHEV